MRVHAESAIVFFELEAELACAEQILPRRLCDELQTAARACSRMYPFPVFVIGAGTGEPCSIGDCRTVFRRTVRYLTEEARPHYGTEDPKQQPRIDDMLWLRSKVLSALHAIH